MRFQVGQTVRLRDEWWAYDELAKQAGLKPGVDYLVESIPVGADWVGIRGHKNPDKRYPGWSASRFELAPKKEKAMPEFDGPGDGWRELQQRDVEPAMIEKVIWVVDKTRRVWVREEPVPPLPIESYTVIRVPTQGAGDDQLLVMVESGQWVDVVTGRAVDHRYITGFEVLAEPVTRIQALWHDMLVRERRETAKAVAQMIEQGATWDTVRREFGVEVSS